MDASAATLWWIACGVLVAAEMGTGTFYLLMLALGAAAAALAAHAGVGATAQWVAASLVGGGATALWHLRRARAPRSKPATANRDVNLDIGERVQVTRWQSDGSARVSYRGAAWTVRTAAGTTPRPGEQVIVAVEGNRLIVEPAPPG
jgi:membrane protein implicated in regulation of membrane protease activity